ncbi:hypothetical protein CLHOM_15080 [Clostridium homopropionicum DSM 5847]|uniref:Leucine-binding protein domain-containing protein n=1 Tax=Clostridium homopropionicum DSM 5847 TaxID=1121318 RepID=A0A0L6ZB87_9CLOT|nr:ABC transporter substrate-binding protein [Clostridium homopropionicum]KOA20078.1 hypothetical protein CLHOM_15080 [Clostridium homopropionicum DSM 5847]SFG86056.1 amino acid/amide ABC transporter substrate-binding protein, HAAT family [Clostridium homopropionicum]
MNLQVDKWHRKIIKRDISNKRWFSLLLCILLTLGIYGCRSTQKSNEKEINIAVLGDSAWLTSDKTFLNGVQLALEEVNSKYGAQGFTIKTKLVDDKDVYENGVEEAIKLAKDSKVTAILNTQNFDVSKTTADILSESKKIVLFPYGAYDSIFLKSNPYLFCTVPAFSDLGKVMADYAVNKGYKRIAIYYNGKQSQEELVTALELQLSNKGSKVMDYVPAITSESEFDLIYSRWKTIGVDCVVISQYGADRAFEILKMLRSRDSNIAVMGEPIFNGAKALKDNISIAEGMVVPSTVDIENSKGYNEFMQKYKARFKEDGDIWAIQGYDMVKLIVDKAAELGTNDPVKIANSMHDKKGYDGTVRKISFESGGAMILDTNKLPMLKCVNGQFVAIN